MVCWSIRKKLPPTDGINIVTLNLFGTQSQHHLRLPAIHSLLHARSFLPDSLSARSTLQLKRWDLPSSPSLHSTHFPLHLTDFRLLTFGFLHQTLDILVSVTLSRSPLTTAFDKPSEPTNNVHRYTTSIPLRPKSIGTLICLGSFKGDDTCLHSELARPDV